MDADAVLGGADGGGAHAADAAAAGAGGGGAEGGGEEEAFIVPEVRAVAADFNAFFAAQMLPRARAIETEVASLTYEANAVSDRAEAEKAELLKELGRLSDLCMHFHKRIAQFLHFGSTFGGQP